MIDASNARSVTTLQLLASIDAADTAAASTATGLDISEFEGFLIVTQNAGILDAGTLDGTIITSATSNLASPTTVGTFTQCGTSTDVIAESVFIEVNKCQKYIGYVGTIATGGALVGVTAVGSKKYV